jgi:hypothetical protein
MTQLFPSRDRQKLRKNRPHAAKAGETACPTIGNTGLAVVAQALSPAAFEFFSAPQGVGSREQASGANYACAVVLAAWLSW